MVHAGEGFEAPDIVLSCAKGHHLPQALATLKRLVGVNTLLVTIQVLHPPPPPARMPTM